MYDDVASAVRITDDQLFLPRDTMDLVGFMDFSVLIPILFNYKNHVWNLANMINVETRQ
ncbi:unnamed protein product [Absidia cylindrospora]